MNVGLVTLFDIYVALERHTGQRSEVTGQRSEVNSTKAEITHDAICR
jgi:hypothetical protein